MSETRELQRFHRDYDYHASRYREAAQKGYLDGERRHADFMRYLDKCFVHIDQAIDERVETVLEEVER